MERRLEEKISHHNNELSRPLKRRQGLAGEENSSDSCYLSSDLTVDILLKLPAKSLARFNCVSKPWSSLVNDTIKTRSLTQPRLLLIFHDSYFCKSCLHTYPLDTNNNSKTFVSADKDSDYHTKVLKLDYSYVHGLICCWSRWDQVAIYNPTTNQSVLLPYHIGYEDRISIDVLFGYDPVTNQYKVLCFNNKKANNPCQVFTLGQQCWRDISISSVGKLKLTPLVTSVCIDGIIYFMGGGDRSVIRKFHVSSERFDHIQIPETEMEVTLVNYRGKLGCVYHGGDDDDDDDDDDVAELWIMEDDDHNGKQEWSMTRLLISPRGLLSCSLKNRTFVIAGVTLDGEIVIMPRTWSYAETLYAHFHDPKQNKTRRVGFETNMKGELKNRLGICILCAPDHIENIMPL